MAEKVIRPATREDISMLAELKSRYVRLLYRGFIPDAFLAIAEPAYYYNQLQDWLTQGKLQMDTLWVDGQPGGYIVYGVDGIDTSYGYIQEAAMALPLDAQDHALLYQHALAALDGRGLGQVHQWVLRDNFRVRFQLEHSGFKADGARRTITLEGQPLQIARYLYRAHT